MADAWKLRVERYNSPLENYRVIFRRDNGANEGNISSLLDYCRMQPIEDKVNTPKGGGGQNSSLLINYAL